MKRLKNGSRTISCISEVQFLKYQLLSGSSRITGCSATYFGRRTYSRHPRLVMSISISDLSPKSTYSLILGNSARSSFAETTVNWCSASLDSNTLVRFSLSVIELTYLVGVADFCLRLCLPMAVVTLLAIIHFNFLAYLLIAIRGSSGATRCRFSLIPFVVVTALSFTSRMR